MKADPQIERYVAVLSEIDAALLEMKARIMVFEGICQRNGTDQERADASIKAESVLVKMLDLMKEKHDLARAVQRKAAGL